MSTGSLGNEIVCLSETRSPSSYSLACLLRLRIPAFLRLPAMAARTEGAKSSDRLATLLKGEVMTHCFAENGNDFRSENLESGSDCKQGNK